MLMYEVFLGREFKICVDTLVEGLKIATGCFNNGWEAEVVNISTGETMASFIDSETPYFSSSIHEII